MERKQYVIGSPAILNETAKWEYFCDAPCNITLMNSMNSMTLSVMSAQDQSLIRTINFSDFLCYDQPSLEQFHFQTASGSYSLKVYSKIDADVVKTFLENVATLLKHSETKAFGTKAKIPIPNYTYDALNFNSLNKSEKQSDEELLSNNLYDTTQKINPIPREIVIDSEKKGLNEEETICELIRKAVEFGKVEEAKDLVEKLAEKGSKLSVHVLYEKYPCNDFCIHVQVADRDSLNQVEPVLIIPINPFITTVSMLKCKISKKYQFPYSCQRWIINNKVVKDHELLSMCGVQHSGTVIFLYLTSKVARTMEKSIQTDHEPDKLGSLGKHKQPVSFQSIFDF